MQQTTKQAQQLPSHQFVPESKDLAAWASHKNIQICFSFFLMHPFSNIETHRKNIFED